MYRLFKGRTAAKAATGALVGLALCSCASPYVAPRDLAESENAQIYASKQAGELHKKLEKLDKYDRRTGAVILGSSVAAIALGAYGAHADALLGASFIGTATYGAREYVPIQDRKRIYANGASAIRCAIAAFSFKDLEPAIGATKSSLKTLTPLSPLPYQGLGLGIQDAEEKRDKAEDRANEFIAAAEVVKDEKKADMLIAATNAILDSVTEQLIETQLDPDGARNALTSSAETHASALREAYEALEAAVSEAQEESEETEQAARVLLLASNFSAEVLGNGGDGAMANDVADAGVAAEKNTSNLKAVVSSATRVLEILNLQSTCAAQL